MTSLDELDERISARLKVFETRMRIQALVGALSFIAANIIIVGGIVWWASRIDDGVSDNTADIAALYELMGKVENVATAQARLEVLVQSGESRLGRMESQLDSIAYTLRNGRAPSRD